MAEPATQRMTIDEFLVWCDRHGGEDKWELIDGEPRMMVRPLPIHQLISYNMTSEFETCLRDTPCVAIQEGAVRTAERQLRFAGVTVYCGDVDVRRQVMGPPTVVAEILSPSTEGFDLVAKHEEFRSIESVRHIVFVHAERVHASVWTRTADGWTLAEANETDDAISLDAIDCRIEMARLYRNTDLT